MKEFEQKVQAYLTERGWDHLRPSDLAKSIMIEGGELLEIFQWENLSLEEVKANEEKIAQIRKELADVLIYSFEMAVLLGIDVNEIVNQKLDKAAEKYPAELFNKEANAKNPGTEDLYLKIKADYRKEGKN